MISYFIERESIARQRDARGNTPTMFAERLMRSENLLIDAHPGLAN